MPPDISILYKCVSDLLRIPQACKYFEDAGGYIISTGLVWPMETTDGEMVYYYINVVDREIRFLPDFSADLHTAEVVTDLNKILFVFKHLIDYVQAANKQEVASSPDSKQILEIRFLEGETPKINITTQRVLFFWNFSLS